MCATDPYPGAAMDAQHAQWKFEHAHQLYGFF